MTDTVAPLLAKARAARRKGDSAAAYASQQAAIDQLRAAHDPRLPSALRHAVEMAVEAGLADEALADRTEMITLYRAMRDVVPLDLANAIRVVAVHAQAVGDRETARANWQEARSLYAELRVEEGVAEADKALATIG